MLETYGFGEVWALQYVENEALFLTVFKQRLFDIFLQSRNEFFDVSSKCYLYKHLVDNFCLQFYLRKNVPNHYCRLISKFRMSAHNLYVEKGRYNNIDRQNRICVCCDLQVIEDEYHFILKCPKYAKLRTKCIKPFYYRRPSSFKLALLLSSQNVTELCNLGKYLFNALKQRDIFFM